jgi:hypothetical protein
MAKNRKSVLLSARIEQESEFGNVEDVRVLEDDDVDLVDIGAHPNAEMTDPGFHIADMEYPRHIIVFLDLRKVRSNVIFVPKTK